MIDTQWPTARRAVPRALAWVFLFTAAYAANGSDARPADEAYLDAMQGNWDMTGTLLGKPVRYRAHGERVLQGGFLLIHMIDAGEPPAYEADLFLGYDPKAGDYIAHWLDRFGAAGERVVGRGQRTADTLVIEFPYADGTFKDTFSHDAKSGRWSLLIESQTRDGGWRPFATYTMLPAPSAP